MTALNTTVTAAALESVASGKLGFTNMVEYGVTLAELASGTTPPPQGARFDLTLEGQLTGPITGKMLATDYINVRADGRFELNMFGQISTTDGALISFEGHGVSVHNPNGTEGVRMSVQLVTQSSEYAWVNSVAFIAEGIVDAAANTLEMSLLK